MPKSTKAKLAYQKERNASPEEKAYRAELGRERYAAEKAGKVHKGDNRDLSHKRAHANGGSVEGGNYKIESREKNRGWRSGQTGKDSYKVPDKK